MLGTNCLTTKTYWESCKTAINPLEVLILMSSFSLCMNRCNFQTCIAAAKDAIKNKSHVLSGFYQKGEKQKSKRVRQNKKLFNRALRNKIKRQHQKFLMLSILQFCKICQNWLHASKVWLHTSWFHSAHATGCLNLNRKFDRSSCNCIIISIFLTCSQRILQTKNCRVHRRNAWMRVQ